MSPGALKVPFKSRSVQGTLSMDRKGHPPMKYVPALVALTCVLLASATAKSQVGVTMPAWVVPAMQEAGKQVFNDHCAACHLPRAGKAFGPSLAGVIGRRAASLPGFRYSEGLRRSGLVWTESNLIKWIANNRQMVPGSPMPHPSLNDPAEEAYLVAYLKTLGTSSVK